MLDAFRDLIGRVGTRETERHFSGDDERLALAALLVHCTAIDGTSGAAEQEKLRHLMEQSFGLTGADLQALLADARDAEHEAVDLYRFTSVLKRRMSEEERIQVVESLWEIVYADGESHEFEENLVWRVAELLGVHRRDRIARKRAVAENKPSDQ